MTVWLLVAAFCMIGFVLVFAWPWVDPYLTRRDVPARLLDRLEEEWEREGEPPTTGWGAW